METAGLMTDAGGACCGRPATGWWTISDTVEDLVEPGDLTARRMRTPRPSALERVFGQRPQGDALVGRTAAQDQTRARRIEAIVDQAAHGARPEDDRTPRVGGSSPVSPRPHGLG